MSGFCLRHPAIFVLVYFISVGMSMFSGFTSPFSGGSVKPDSRRGVAPVGSATASSTQHTSPTPATTNASFSKRTRQQPHVVATSKDNKRLLMPASKTSVGRWVPRRQQEEQELKPKTKGVKGRANAKRLINDDDFNEEDNEEEYLSTQQYSKKDIRSKNKPRSGVSESYQSVYDDLLPEMSLPFRGEEAENEADNEENMTRTESSKKASGFVRSKSATLPSSEISQAVSAEDRKGSTTENGNDNDWEVVGMPDHGTASANLMSSGSESQMQEGEGQELLLVQPTSSRRTGILAYLIRLVLRY